MERIDSNEPVPPRLYHYTSLESLALILAHKTIRLMPITEMDDLQEARTSDIPNIGRFVYASSWTDNKSEEIPMWNMYASLESGVRISLPTMPFKHHRLTKEEYSHATGIPVDHISSESEYIESFLHPSILARGLSSPSFLSDEGVLLKVKYTQDKEKLEPKVLMLSPEGSTSINLGTLGEYKNEYWQFQREWRYRLFIIPVNMLDMSGDPSARFAEMTAKMLMGVLPSPCPYYDIDIDEKAMEKLEVVASPKMSAGNILLLKTLLQHYGCESALKESELTGLL